MVVRGHFVNVVAGEVQRVGVKPAVAGVVDVFDAALGLDLVRDAPRRCAATAIFLSDRKSNALVHSSGPHRHLSGIGASGSRRVGGIERKRIAGLRGNLLDSVNQAADAPSPGGVFARVASVGETMGGVACASGGGR